MTQENHLAMKSSVQLFSEWEIRLLVLLSFTMQLFLFFVGGLRRRITNSALRFSIWLAYLGADMVAVYVLGLISRVHLDATTATHHHLAFLWAPFLLIHLGGQDTVTAFAIEDISLWLRHLLNLVVQVSLTLYIFCKTTNGLNIQELLLPTILLFVSGIIKYGERTWALCCGSLINIAKFPIPQYLADLDRIHVGSSYSGLVSKALFSIKEVRWIFSSYSPLGTDLTMNSDLLLPDYSAKLFEIMEIELGLMFDDIYTKAQVLRTWGGIILRCLSDISFLAAFVLFSVRNKEGYNTVDTAITYVLFIGGFSLEVLAVFIAMMSPWIWAWLKTRRCSFLASISISWQRKRVLWSKCMGQYSLLNYLGQCDQQSSKVMAVVRRLVNAVCGRKQKLWVSKLLDTKFVEVDEKVMRCIVQRVKQYQSTGESSILPQWPNLGPLLQRSLRVPEADFHFPVLVLHIYTAVMLSRYAPTTVDSEPRGGVDRVCRTISNYMAYLCATHHEMLSVQNSSNQSDLAYILHRLFSVENNTDITNIMHKAVGFLTDCCFPKPAEVCTEAHLLEIQDAWVGFLLHAASKSRPEMHAAQLARGGEFLTFIWLLMAHCNLGNSRGCPIELLPISGDVQWRCVFHIRPPPQSS